MLKTLCVLVLSFALAGCGGSADAAEGQPAELGGCCAGCAADKAEVAPAGEAACCADQAKAGAEGACCAEEGGGVCIPPAEPKKVDDKQ